MFEFIYIIYLKYFSLFERTNIIIKEKIDEAKKELLKQLNRKEVLCAEIMFIGYPDEESRVVILLPVKYSEKQWEDFLNKIESLYSNNNEFFLNSIIGTIWYTDKSYSDIVWEDEDEEPKLKYFPPYPEIPIALLKNKGNNSV